MTSPYHATSENLTPRVHRYSVGRRGHRLGFVDVLDLWRQDPDFPVFFSTLLASSPFSAFRWETPPLTHATVGQPFEFVLIDSPFLLRKPDPTPFMEYFSDTAGGDVIVFPNLGRDATLVVPTPKAERSCYGHLGSFLRSAPEKQTTALWRVTARTVLAGLTRRPLWLSTAGGGVDWLHVRLDAQPKYYAHAPYRDPPHGRA